MEIWKDIEGYEGLYQVSDQGRVKSLTRHVLNRRYRMKGYKIHKEHIIKQSLDHKGYLRVRFCDKSIKSTIRIHRLVAVAFKDNPDNLPQVNHIDGIKTNNNVDNLEWCTNKHNQEHAYKIGLVHKRRNIKLTPMQVQIIRDTIKIGYPKKDIASYFNVARSTISMINKGNRRAIKT